MKKVLIVIELFLIFLLIYFLQTHFFSWYNIAGIQPNLFIILMLFIGLYIGKKYGLILGIIFGLILDLFIGKRIGIYAIELGIAGIIGEILDKKFSKESRMTFILMTMFTTLLCETINYILQITILDAEPIVLNFIKIILVEAIYNAILIIILYPLIQKAGDTIEENFKKRKFLMNYY